MVADLVFYLFSAVAVISSLMVISARNPVHSVLFLVLTFFNTAGLFVLLQAEFLAAVLVMVYMGAVAILFLFVVMMLDVDFSELRKGMVQHLPLGLAVGAVLLLEMVIIATAYHAPETVETSGSNVTNLGRALYGTYLYPFEISSLILLVALIGAVVLTLRKRPDSRKQKICEQLARHKADAVELKQVASGEGAKKL